MPKSLETIIWFVIMFLCLAPSVFPDELQIPVSCFPQKIQAKFIEKGYKLDLSANDRDENSWGFLVSKGDSFSIFTYKPVTKKEMYEIQNIITGD